MGGLAHGDVGGGGDKTIVILQGGLNVGSNTYGGGFEAGVWGCNVNWTRLGRELNWGGRGVLNSLFIKIYIVIISCVKEYTN